MLKTKANNFGFIVTFKHEKKKNKKRYYLWCSCDFDFKPFTIFAVVWLTIFFSLHVHCGAIDYTHCLIFFIRFSFKPPWGHWCTLKVKLEWQIEWLYHSPTNSLLKAGRGDLLFVNYKNRISYII